MDPEEPLVSLLRNSFADRSSRILEQELSNHCLSDRVDDLWVGGRALTSRATLRHPWHGTRVEAAFARAIRSHALPARDIAAHAKV